MQSFNLLIKTSVFDISKSLAGEGLCRTKCFNSSQKKETGAQKEQNSMSN